MKTARNIHQLNKEIGELETLIESKIYREVRIGFCPLNNSIYLLS